MDKEIIKYKNIVSGISVIMLLLAIPTFWPYGYYILLRWMITISAVFLLSLAYESKKTFWLFSMGIIAILFNPIIPVYLNKETWVMIDLIVAILFLVSIFKIKDYVQRKKD
jgi:hypothetical protein